MKMTLFICLVFLPNLLFSQDYVQDNEKMVFSFTTLRGKILVIAIDTAETYAVYRYGTKDKIEFEFPEEKEESWSKFKYSFYLRGGGPQNDGMELNYLYFTNGDYRYVVYSEYYASDNSSNCGIKVINLKNQKTITIKGDISTKQGTLADFRYNDYIEKTEELFE